MKPWTRLAIMGVCAAGCDAQTGDAYRGEPLLTMTGSVELALEVENEGELMPALAFRGLNDDMYVVEADVTGQFPAEFTLNVYEPPPEAAIYSLPDYHDARPRVAIGYITAITDDTPAMFRYSSSQTGGNRCWLDEATGLQSCERTQTWCTDDESVCYSEITTCPDVENQPDECTTRSEGDPELRKEREDGFAGLSENYMVLWLEEPAAPKSWIAYIAGRRDEGLAQGYHLLARAEQPDTDAHSICEDEASALAAQWTNERFDTSHDAEQLSMLCEEVEGCEHAEIYAAFRGFEHDAVAELDCPTDDVVITRVDDPASHPISVRIGPDLEGF